MPTYEYRCDDCDTTFDVVQSFHDDPLTACPTCGSPVRKVFGSVGIVFKGSGFYKTDSRSGGGSSTKTGESTAPAATSGGDSAAGGSGSDSGGSSSGGSDKSTSTDKSTAKPAPAAASKPAGGSGGTSS